MTDGGVEIAIETDGIEPFRIWIDTVSEERTVVRTRLDVCPPASGDEP